MPPAMAKRVSESINRKRITPEGELQDALDEMARDIALIEPNPKDWAWWVSYLIEQLEKEAMKRGKMVDFGETLKSLLDNL